MPNPLENVSHVALNDNPPRDGRVPTASVDVEDHELRYGCSAFDLLDSDDIDWLKASGTVWLPVNSAPDPTSDK